MKQSSVASKTVTDSARQALKILLVDDHHDTCAALEKLLARRGHLVAVSHDVRSAMEAAVRNKFDLLISDIALPDGTGMDLMMQLRAIANVPGIAISGFGNNGDIERSLQAGFSEHLIKPIKLDNLEAAIERALGATDTWLGDQPASVRSCDPAPLVVLSRSLAFINTALQRGVQARSKLTAETPTVGQPVVVGYTQLKQGVMICALSI